MFFLRMRDTRGDRKAATIAQNLFWVNTEEDTGGRGINCAFPAATLPPAESVMCEWEVLTG